MTLGQSFLILLWKQWLLWWHYRIVTLVMILLPLTLSCVLVYLNFNAETFDLKKSSLRIHNATIYSKFDPTQVHLKGNILYLPQSNASKLLLEMAFHNFSELGLIGVQSEEYIEDKARTNSSGIIAAIVFSDSFNAEEIPSDLVYKLRLPSKFIFHNDKTYLYSSKKEPRLKNNFGHSVYAESGFLGLQSLIDLAYIDKQQERTGKRKRQFQVSVNCMPYPSYDMAESVFSVIDLIPIIVIYGFIVLCPAMVKLVVDEKASGAKEMIKMLGTSSFVYWASSFVSNFIMMLIPSVIVTILYKIEFKDGSSVLGPSSSTLFLLTLLMYNTTSILFCFVMTTFFNRTSVAMATTVVLWAVTYTLPSIYYTPIGKADAFVATSYNVKVALCLLPNMAFNWALKVVSAYDSYGIGAQWDNMFIPPFKGGDSFSLATALGMMIVSVIVYSILLWYLDATWPWQPGVPKPFCFCLKLSYWYAVERKETTELFAGRKTSYHEEEPIGIYPTVVISNLTKVYRSGALENKAVDSLSLNIYPGQITVLLGHNGAGKTTTMNIITGVFPPTKGVAIINGHDVTRQTMKARKNIGLCTQHNIHYDVLTVEEHLRLFAGLRGISWRETIKEATTVIKLLDMEQKRYSCSRELSGGMKRKLSLGIAIVGGPEVLILDEPTSGMDPEARREVWDVLLNLRPGRTILLTTHHMEEADALGDRVAIMARGFVQCSGSPIFLKGKFGAGYHLHISKGDKCRPEEITKTVKKHITDAELVEDFGLELIYSLSNETSEFASMFQELEDESASLGIESCGVTVTTMDDVFLKVGQVAEALLEESIPIGGGSSFLQLGEEDEDVLTPSSKSTGVTLKYQQMTALLLKRAKHAKRRYVILLMQIVLPAIIFSFLIYLDEILRELIGKKTGLLSLNLKALYDETIGFYQLTTQSHEEVMLKNVYESILRDMSVSVSEVTDPERYLLQEAETNLKDYVENYLVGGSIEEHNGNFNVTAWFNGVPHHLDPISINIMTNSILQHVVRNKSASIKISNHPLPASRKLDIRIPNLEATSHLLFASFVPLVTTFLTSGFILFPIHERTSKGKLLQEMCGVSTTLYWLANFAWDLLVHNAACLVLTIPLFANHLINSRMEANAIGAIYTIFVFYGFPSISATYALSYTSNLPSTGFALSVIGGIVTGNVACLTMQLLNFVSSFPRDVFDILLWIVRVSPHFSAAWSVNNINVRSLENERCSTESKTVIDAECSNPARASLSRFFPCCPKEICKERCHQNKCYLCWEKSAAGRELMMLAITGVLSFAFVVLLDSFIPKQWHILRRRTKKYLHEQKKRLTDGPIEDSDVSDERQRVEKLFYGSLKKEALIVYNLTKYFGIFRAVNNVSFAVRKKECFGLLGINGAGKTTTFRMLTGDLPPTQGNAHIENYNILQSLRKFQTMIGYCPQFDALIDQLTGREMLHLYANLRGIKKYEVIPHVNKIIELCDLLKHADYLTYTYSGGTKRKLSLAIALIGSPPLVLLDEPTAGVDPSSRRKIWKTLTTLKQILGTSFVLTSHSMDECEALCTRLAIMVAGNLRCLGSMQHLKSKFGQGFTLVVKLKQADSIYADKLSQLKNYIKEYFPSAELKDEHQGILHFHITDPNMKWSHMFSKMEQAKKKFHLEDYLLSDTTLEQIFLAFAQIGRKI